MSRNAALAAVKTEPEPEPQVTRRKVPVAMIKNDPDLQPRAKIDRKTVDHYAALLREGVALPPVVLVFDGEIFLLADGFHRTYAHEDAGLQEIEAVIHKGDKTDAVRLSLRANAEHGRPRSETDLKRAYQKAVQFGLVEPHDWRGLKELLACSQERAYLFTQKAREELERKRRRRMYELRAQGLSFAKIGEAVGVSKDAVRLFIASLPDDPKPDGENERPVENSRASSASGSGLLVGSSDLEPEELDIEDALAEPAAEAQGEPVADAGGAPEPEPEPDELTEEEQAELDELADQMADRPETAPDPDDEPEDEGDPDPGLDPVAEYERQRAAEAHARQLWGDTLRALETFANLPPSEELFANRYRKFDHLFGPALDGVVAWLTTFKELWDGGKA